MAGLGLPLRRPEECPRFCAELRVSWLCVGGMTRTLRDNGPRRRLAPPDSSGIGTACAESEKQFAEH